MADKMSEDITKIKEVTIRNESKLDSICDKLYSIHQRQDYQRDFMLENRDKINWNKQRVYMAMGGVAFALSIVPLIVYYIG